ncbi:MAG: hypothetical protein RR051_04060 [Clostridiales bacterium]
MRRADAGVCGCRLLRFAALAAGCGWRFLLAVAAVLARGVLARGVLARGVLARGVLVRGVLAGVCSRFSQGCCR